MLEEPPEYAFGCIPMSLQKLLFEGLSEVNEYPIRIASGHLNEGTLMDVVVFPFISGFCCDYGIGTCCVSKGMCCKTVPIINII